MYGGLGVIADKLDDYLPENAASLKQYAEEGKQTELQQLLSRPEPTRSVEITEAWTDIKREMDEGDVLEAALRGGQWLHDATATALPSLGVAGAALVGGTLAGGVTATAAGASADFTVTLSSNVNNYNLATDLTNNGSNYGAGNWDGTSAITVVLNIDAGVTVYSANTSTPALVVDLATSDSVLTINNSGNVVGKGGAGGTGDASNGATGGAGGHAMTLRS